MKHKVRRTCEHCQQAWTADLDFEAKLTREIVRGSPRASRADLFSLDLGQAIQQRIRAQVVDVALGDSMAAQELKLARTCPSCRTYLRYREVQLSEKDLAGLLNPVQAQPQAQVGVLAALSEFDRLLDLLANDQITPQEFTKRRQKIMSF
ncbi:hypothetical protein [Deinococcus roseus]|uniref:SHOCT domain-containing protein n=1 Tax=Deinococcus roseus TaxID=392414 RepID=A0ABQ2CV60_9DEIO|nr:hypothetical protein [Deinococcus roseus]GGJ23937.1 hypothetical protein GCM10008938_07640 [Deinococcus roseus]